MADASIKEVMEYFEMDITAFRSEWSKLSDEEKAYFRDAVGAVMGR